MDARQRRTHFTSPSVDRTIIAADACHGASDPADVFDEADRTRHRAKEPGRLEDPRNLRTTVRRQQRNDAAL
jgi:hypothetical protein